MARVERLLHELDLLKAQNKWAKCYKLKMVILYGSRILHPSVSEPFIPLITVAGAASLSLH